eukprot:9286630-Pyramimonas_sp.AAC.1
MRHALECFMQSYGLFAANTFGDRAVTWESYARAHSRLARAPEWRPRVLDYVLVPHGWDVIDCKASFRLHRGGKTQRS